jgi:hypothetical protein
MYTDADLIKIIETKVNPHSITGLHLHEILGVLKETCEVELMKNKYVFNTPDDHKMLALTLLRLLRSFNTL